MNPEEYGSMVDKYTAFGSVATAIALARDVGILNILYEAEVPMTSQEIADKGRLKERYVRELLASLTTGRVVQVDETSTRFHIAPELKPVLKSNVIMTRFMPYFGQKYGAMMNCFNKDGPDGVRYSEHPVIFEIMDDLRVESQDRLLERDVLPSAPGLIEKLESGIDVAEIGSANGTLILNLCKRFPNTRFTGSDVVESVLDVARRRCEDRGLTNCRFITLDVCNLPQSPAQQFDWIFARDVIHDLPDPQGALNGMYRMLKPGGMFSMVEYGTEGSLADNVGNIDMSFLYMSSVFVCLPESYQGKGSMALGPCWGAKTARQMIANAGFNLVNEHHSEWHQSEVTFVCQRPE